MNALVHDIASRLLVPAAWVLAAAALGAAAWAITRALRAAARKVDRALAETADTKAWRKSTTSAEADAMDRHLDLAEAVDAALPTDLIHQLLKLYALEEEQA